MPETFPFPPPPPPRWRPEWSSWVVIAAILLILVLLGLYLADDG